MTEDCTQKDLMWLVGCLQCELESREFVIDRLKRHLFQENGLKVSQDPGEPLQALARDKFFWNEPQGTSTGSESQLRHLEQLLESQQEVQCNLKQHIQNLEANHSVALTELERYKKLENGLDSDVVNSLKKECTQLRLQISEEQQKRIQLVNDLKQLLHSWCDQKKLINTQKHVAVLILKERRHLLQQLMLDQQRITELEKALSFERSNCCCSSKQDISCGSEVQKSQIKTHSFDVPRVVSRSSDYLMGFSSKDVHSNIESQSKFVSPCSENKKPVVESNSGERTVHPNHLSTQHQRSKPNPPARRSSEIKATTSAVISDQSDLSNVHKAVDSNSFTVRSNSEPIMPTSLSISVSLSSTDSRSSTPSPPPPPPPPVQLHFPYPGMLGHPSTSLYQTHSRSQFLGASSARRPTGSAPPNWLFHSDISNSLASRTSQLASFNQPTYPTSVSVLPKLPHPVIPRGTVSNKPICTDANVQSPLRYHHLIPAPCTTSPIGFTSPSSPLLASSAHRLPAYYVPSISPGSGGSGVGSLRSLRTAVNIPSTDLTVVSSTGDTGHLCINGK